jgi:outer membrane receptor protein involved in Fe transport
MGRLSASWDPTENIELYGKLEFADLEWHGRTTQQLLCLPGAPIVPEVEDCVFNETRALDADPTAYPLNFFSVDNPPGENFVNDLEQLGGQVQATWRAADVEVTSVTSYFDYKNEHFAKADHNVLDRAIANFTEDFEQFSQEIRIRPTNDSAVDWLAGVYYDTNNNDDFTNIALPVAMNMAIRRSAIEDQDSWAVFGEAAVPVGQEVTVKVGGRYSVVEKDFDYTAWIYSYVPNQDFASNANLLTSFSFNDLSREDKKFQPSFVAEWRPVDGIMLYFSYKEGFKAGGFDHQMTSPNDIPPFEPEEAESFEIGAKMDFWEGRARLNATLFSVDYSDLQVSTFTGTIGFRTTNAGESSTEGLELDGSFLLTDHLTLSGYLSFLSAEYDSFENAQCYLNPPQTEAEGCVNGVQDLSGSELQFAPDYSGTLSLDYRAPLTDALEVFGRVDLFFTDDYQIDSDGDPDTRQSSYEKWDARFGVGSMDGRWEVAFIGRNLTDEQIKVWMGDTPVNGQSHFAILDRTRQYGVQGRLRF